MVIALCHAMHMKTSIYRDVLVYTFIFPHFLIDSLMFLCFVIKHSMRGKHHLSTLYSSKCSNLKVPNREPITQLVICKIVKGLRESVQNPEPQKLTTNDE